eukprot:gb/GFBE01064130.1/.p1 GENE.gb/GFBE01064130.1/~~gb/GFBE01064130.1/.p1  ORF type:complete len:173 (+),score=45.60 gb/GFBE01064130.1/:1-519(+)
MEPLPLFDGGCQGTWVQSDDAVTITVPMPEGAAAGLKPRVVVRPRHLCVTSPRPGMKEEADGAAEEQVTLLDSDLGGEVSVQDTTWTLSDGTVVIELAKKPDFGKSPGKSAGGASQGELRPPWWTSAVSGGKTGPADPKAQVETPELRKLDAKIGEQVVTKKSFEGKSKFQW